MMTREEHVAWCKQRALPYIDRGQYEQALTSMMSDLDKHESTRGHVGSMLGFKLLIAGQLSSPVAMRDFINGFM